MSFPSTKELVRRARAAGLVVPAFNIPYLPMVKPVVQALRDYDSFGLIMAARLEWEKFETGSLEALREVYGEHALSRHTRLHLDHVPVIDEDNREVDYLSIIARALKAGYESVMVDGSRLPLDENVACTKRVVELAHAAGVPVEGELGAVMGHEDGPLPPYEELFASGRGFTDPEEAARFVVATDVDWLSVAIGNIHGAISAAAKGRQKVAARLDIAHLERIRQRTDIPLVLHGGTGIRKDCILEAIGHGIAKINVATAIRQPYEQALGRGIEAARQAVYEATTRILRDELEVAHLAQHLKTESAP
jgi:ketose-bisphosphate aldolase